MTIETQLGALERAELIGLAQSLPDVEYVFRHALVQEAAYGSLLRATRRELHRAIGLLLEREYADRLDELAAVLAHHFHAGEDLSRAIEYRLRAGTFAARQYANAEALDHFESALRLIRLGRAEHPQAITTVEPGARAHIARGRLLEITGRFEDALAGYLELEQWAIAAGDQRAEQTALMAQATLRNTPTPVHDPPHGKALMLRILPLVRAAGDRAAEARILWSLMISTVYSGGDLYEAGAYGDSGLAVATAAGLTEMRALILHDFLFVDMVRHGPTRADASLVEAVGLWRQLDNPPLLAETLIFRSMIAAMMGHYDESIALSREAKQVGADARHRMSDAYADIMMERVLEDRGSPGEAIRVAERAIRLADETQAVGTRIFARLDLGLAYGRLGAIAQGQAVVRESGQVMREIVPYGAIYADVVLARLRLLAGDTAGARKHLNAVGTQVSAIDVLRHQFSTFPPGVGDVLLAEAETRVAEGDAAGALAWLDAGEQTLRHYEMRPAQCEALLWRGRALHALGRDAEAGAVLDEARTAAETIGSRRLLWQILAERARSDHANASALREKARALVAQIAADVPDDQMRAAFLNGAHGAIDG